jgi:hypothetical protein
MSLHSYTIFIDIILSGSDKLVFDLFSTSAHADSPDI